MEKAEDNKEPGLRRQLGFTGGVAILVGTIVGSGIFMTANVVAENTGSTGLLLIVWCGSGLITFCAAMSFNELSLIFPDCTGAEYDFIYEVMGDLPAFVCGLSNVFVQRAMSLAMIALACGEYVLAVARVSDVTYAKIIAAVIIVLLVLVNCASVKYGTVVQDVFTVLKVIALIMISITGVVRLAQGHTGNFRNMFEGSVTGVSDICYAFYGAMFAFGGWNQLACMTAELRNPTRDIPRIMWTGVVIITGCYVMVNVAYLTLFTPTQLASTTTVGVLFGNALYGPMAWTIPVFVACSTFGSSNGTMITTSRQIYAVARKGHLPRILSMVHKTKNTPIVSLVFLGMATLILLIPESSNFSTLLTYSIFIQWIFFFLAIICLFWLRYKKPDLKRPYKAFLGFPLVVLVVSLYSVVTPFLKHPLQSTYILLGVCACAPLYYPFVKYSHLLPTKPLDKLGEFLKKYNLEYPAEEHHVIHCDRDKVEMSEANQNKVEISDKQQSKEETNESYHNKAFVA